VFLLATACVAIAQTNVSVVTPAPTQSSSVPVVEESPEPLSWLARLWSLPIFHPFSLLFFEEPVTANPVAVAAAPVLSNCNVEPLPEIRTAEALDFESKVGSSEVVDLQGLTSATAEALERFQRAVNAVGGKMVLTSAYRPAAYQEHLQAVWHKWMELRRNNDEGCQALKASVEEEFTRHQLLLSQHPVPVSDHTLGIGFDAWVAVPQRARLNRRRVSLDSLARLSGILRPSVRRDPVHFRLIGGRG
jgi:D-alanyl-D-alanine dipeptidase